MALIRSNKYPSRWNTPSVNSPQGNFKNRTTPTSLDGSYLEKDWANDMDAIRQSLFISSGTVLDGNVDEGGNSQAYKALIEQCQGKASFFDEDITSAANVYVVNASANNQPPESLFDGMYIKGILGFDNTGSSTINCFSLGVLNLKNFDGSSLSAGQIKAGDPFEAILFGSSFRVIPRNELDLKFSGKLFNGLHDNLTASTPNIDLVLNNSEFVYVGIISGINTISASGVLKTVMSDSTVRGYQIFTITQENHEQFREVHRRFLSVSGSWLPWENITPSYSNDVNNFSRGGSTYFFDSGSFPVQFDVSSSIATSTSESIGATDSGADNIWTALDDIPSGTKAVIIKGTIAASDSVSGYVTSSLSLRSGDYPITSGTQLLTEARVSGYVSGSTVENWISDIIVPINQSKVLSAYYSDNGKGSCILYLKGFIL